MDIHVHVQHVTVHADPGVMEISGKLDAILAQGRKILMANTETKAILTKIDEETTAVGARVVALLAQVSTGMTPAEVAEINAQGQAIADRLTVIASDPDNAVPPEEPPVV